MTLLVTLFSSVPYLSSPGALDGDPAAFGFGILLVSKSFKPIKSKIKTNDTGWTN